ncbi:hypothetical protein GCM10018987_26360 [Streptomyces cremeus]
MAQSPSEGRVALSGIAQPVGARGFSAAGPTTSAQGENSLTCAHFRTAVAVVAAMAEVGIDISREVPEVLIVEVVAESGVCISLGCGDTWPVFPGKRCLDWQLEGPEGQGVEAVCSVCDESWVLVGADR